MKKLTLILLAGIIAGSCTNSERENRDTNTKDTTNAMVDTINKAQTYTADVDLSASEKVFIINTALSTQRLIEFTHLASQSAKSDELRNYAKATESGYTKMRADLETIAKGKGLLLDKSDMVDDLNLLKKMQDNAFDKSYKDIVMKENANLVQQFNTALTFTNTDLSTFASNSLELVNKNSIDLAKILK